MTQKSDFTIAQTEHGLTVTKINNKKIETLNIPEGITYIGNPDVIEYLFQDCNKLKTILLPSTLKRIELYAFNDCRALETIYIPEGVEYIGARAFEDCHALKEIHIPDSVKEIGTGAFCACEKITQIHLPKSLKKISDSLFYGCKSLNFDLLEIPETITEIGSQAFASTNIQSFCTPDSVTTIGYGLFDRCPSLKSLTISDNVTELGSNIFGQEAPKGLKVRIGPNITKTDVSSAWDTTCNLFKTFPNLYEIRKEGIYNITLGKMLENEQWSPEDFQ